MKIKIIYKAAVIMKSCLILMLCATALLVSCIENQSNNLHKNIITKKVIQEFEDSRLTAEETIIYEYDNPKDIFWKKAVHKDKSGEIIKTVNRKLNKKTKVPEIEFIEELGEITESYKLSYSSNGNHLLYKEEFNGNFEDKRSIRAAKLEYEKGRLISQTVKSFNPDIKFINENGDKFKDYYKIKYFPGPETRPEGTFEPDYYIQFRYVYEDNPDSLNYGKLKFIEKTEFDDKNNPVYHYITEPGCSHESSKAWFKYETDEQGRISTLYSYSDREHKTREKHDSKITYQYDGNGFITSIVNIMYDPELKDYTKLHDSKKYEWILPDVSAGIFDTDFNYFNEHYCFTAGRHSIYKKKVIFNQSPKSKVTEEYFDAYFGEYKSQELNPKLFRKTTEYYK
jgi:hypothetical protein